MCDVPAVCVHNHSLEKEGTKKGRARARYIEREREVGGALAHAEKGERGGLKAGLLVGFNDICLYLHNKQHTEPHRSTRTRALSLPILLSLSLAAAGPRCRRRRF